MFVAAAVGGDLEVVDAVRAMVRAQAGAECATAEYFASEECAIGWAATSDRHAPFALARRGAHGNLLVASGTPIALQGSVDALLARAVELNAAPAAVLLSELDGAFAILHWDAAAHALSIVTDFLGVQPLHLARNRGAFFCSTALRGLTGSGVVASRPDAAAWGSFFVFGHALGNRTLVEGITRASAASILTVRMPGAGEQDRTYWTWPSAPAVRSEPDTQAIVDALLASMHRYREYGHDGAVLMSGGFDSRLVLLSLLRSGVRPRALVVRHTDEAGDADARLGRRAAQHAGVPVEVVSPPDDLYHSAAYRRYLDRSELSNPPLEVFIPRVFSALRPELGCVWDGLCVQALRALPGAPNSFQVLLEKPSLRARSLLAVPSPFRLEWARAMYEGFARLLKEETRRYRDDEHGVMQFSLRNRTRLRIAGNPYSVFAVHALPFTPGLTRDFYSIVARLTNRAKGPHRLIQRVYENHFAEGLRVPFISDGRLVNLSGRRSWDYIYAALVQGVSENWYAAEALRRLHLLQRPVHSCTTQLHALLREESAADDYVDTRALAGNALRPVTLRRLYYWQVGQSLFGPARTRRSSGGSHGSDKRAESAGPARPMPAS
jgi:hypothetical protein